MCKENFDVNDLNISPRNSEIPEPPADKGDDNGDDSGNTGNNNSGNTGGNTGGNNSGGSCTSHKNPVEPDPFWGVGGLSIDNPTDSSKN